MPFPDSRPTFEYSPSRGESPLCLLHPVVTRTLIFGVDQYKFNRRNRCRRTGASRPRCAARIPDRSTGTVDVYAQHAFPPKVSGRTTRPRCVRGGQPDWPGIASSFRASRARPIQLSRSVRMVGAHSKFTFGLSCAVRERRVAASPNGRNFNNFARVTSTPHSTNPACSYDMCAFGVCFSRV